MELLDSEEIWSETASHGSGAGDHAHTERSEGGAVRAEGYGEGEEEGRNDEEDENEKGEESWRFQSSRRREFGGKMIFVAGVRAKFPGGRCVVGFHSSDCAALIPPACEGAYVHERSSLSIVWEAVARVICVRLVYCAGDHSAY